MPGANQPPYVADQLARHETRISNLEKKRPLAPPPRQLDPLRFTTIGAVAANVESTREYADDGAVVITQIRLSLLANASATHTVEVRVDGVAIQQFSLASGSATAVAGARIVVRTGSYVTLKTITATDSALAVKLKLQPH